jgi:cytochrome P450
LIALSDTTSTTLTYLFWTLAERPEWQTRLRDELATVDQASWTDGIPKHAAIASLPLLGAVISEALRLYPAAPSSLLRETPAGGKVLNGIFIPEKVSIQIYLI